MSPTPISSRTRKRVATAAILIAAVAIGAGCTTETRDVRPSPRTVAKMPQKAVTTPPPPSNASNLDPCAMRLHDISGALFLYYFNYQRLPATLGELNSFPGAEQQVPLVCPTSNKAYIYSPDGILLAEQNARIVVYDPTPAHYGDYRWAIRLEDPRENKPLVARVVALPEGFFTLRPPETTKP